MIYFIRNNINTNGYTNKGFIMISKEFLLIPGINKISIIIIKRYNLVKIIGVPNSKRIAGVCMLNKSTLFTEDKNGIIREWKIEGNNLNSISIKENAHEDLFNLIFT